MFGNLFNSIKQGREAGKAAEIIGKVSGLPADDLMIANLWSRAQINQSSGTGCKKGYKT